MQKAGDNQNNEDKEVVFKNCAPFTDCASEMDNTKIDNAKAIDVVIPVHNLIEYSNNYSETGNLQQYYRDEPTLNNFYVANNSFLFNFKR